MPVAEPREAEEKREPVFLWSHCLLIETFFVVIIAFGIAIFALVYVPPPKPPLVPRDLCDSAACHRAIDNIEQQVGRESISLGPCHDFYDHVCGRTNKPVFQNFRKEAMRMSHAELSYRLQTQPVPLVNRSTSDLLAAAFGSCIDMTSDAADVSFLAASNDVFLNIPDCNVSVGEGLDLLLADVFTRTPSSPPSTLFQTRINIGDNQVEIIPHKPLRDFIKASSDGLLRDSFKRTFYPRLPSAKYLADLVSLDNEVAKTLTSCVQGKPKSFTLSGLIGMILDRPQPTPRTRNALDATNGNKKRLTSKCLFSVKETLRAIAGSSVGGLYAYAAVKMRQLLPYLQHNRLEGLIQPTRTEDGGKFNDVCFQLMLRSSWRNSFAQYIQANLNNSDTFEKVTVLVQHTVTELKRSLNSLSWLTERGKEELRQAIDAPHRAPMVDSNIVSHPKLFGNQLMVNSLIYELPSDETGRMARCETSHDLVVDAGNGEQTFCLTHTSVREPFFYTPVPPAVNYGSLGTSAAQQLLLNAFRQQFTDELAKKPYGDRIRCFRDQNAHLEQKSKNVNLLLLVATVALQAALRGTSRLLPGGVSHSNRAEEQLFFLSACRSVCSAHLMLDGNVSAKELCNVPIKNSKQFIRAFDCLPTDRMINDGICQAF